MIVSNETSILTSDDLFTSTVRDNKDQFRTSAIVLDKHLLTSSHAHWKRAACVSAVQCVSIPLLAVSASMSTHPGMRYSPEESIQLARPRDKVSLITEDVCSVGMLTARLRNTIFFLIE